MSRARHSGRRSRGGQPCRVKVRPVSAVFEVGDAVVQVAFNVRIYADGFTADQFGVGPRVEVADQPTEIIRGVTCDVE